MTMTTKTHADELREIEQRWRVKQLEMERDGFSIDANEVGEACSRLRAIAADVARMREALGLIAAVPRTTAGYGRVQGELIGEAVLAARAALAGGSEAANG